MDIFDATQFQPQQGMPAHPPGMFDFQITGTRLQETKDKEGAMFVVEFTSPAGRIENRYNIFNKSAQAVEIAQKQLSALCHATGVFKLSFPKNPDGSPNMQMAGAELRGARGRMEIAPQKNNPEYMEVARVFDTQGNEPGKSGGQAPQPQPQPQTQQQPQGGWGAQPQPNPAPQNGGQAPGWGSQQPQGNANVNAQPQQPQPQANPGGWQQPPQGGNGASPPAWMR